MHTKGQIISLDALLALVILVSLLLTFNNMWALLTSKVDANPEDAQADAQRVLDMLELTPGYPESWNNSNVQLLGLSNPPGVLQGEKLRELLSLNATDMQNMTGVTKYNLYFNITYTNGSAVKVARNVTLLGIPLPVQIDNDTVFGTYPFNSTEVAYARGVAWYNNNRTIMNVMLWK